MAPDHNPGHPWPMPHPVVIPYSRFSNPTQASGYSLERQREDNTEIAKKLGLPLDEEYVDSGLSGYSGEHLLYGVLKVILDRMKNRDIAEGSCLLIDALDRLGRDAIDRATTRFISIIFDHGISIYVKKSHKHYTRESMKDRASGRNDLFMAMMDMARAFDESDDKSRLVTYSKNKQRSEARRRELDVVTAMCPAWLIVVGSGKKRTFQLNPERCHILNEIFQMALSVGVDKIAKRLNERWKAGELEYAPWGLTRGRRITVDGKKVRVENQGSSGWSGAFVGQLLTDRRVLGEWQPVRKNVNTQKERKNGLGPKKMPIPDGDPIPDYYPPAIDEKLFNQVAAVRTGPDRKTVNAGKGSSGRGRRGNGFPNLFTGLATCAECSGPMMYRLSRYPYLICRSYRQGSGCTSRTHHHYTRLEQMISRPVEKGAALLDLLFEAGELTGGASEATRETEAEIARLSKRRDKIMRNLREYDEEEDDIIRQSRKEDYRGWAKERMDLDGRLGDLRRLVEVQKGAVMNQADADAVRRLWAEALTAEGTARYDARSRINSALRSMVDAVFLAEDRAFLFTLGGGSKFVLVEPSGEMLVFYYFGGTQFKRLGADGSTVTWDAPEEMIRHAAAAAKRFPDRRRQYFNRLKRLGHIVEG